MSTKVKAARPRRKAESEEEHENQERWLVTYADVLTLLMVLFIVMFSISQIDRQKFAALKEGLVAGFGAQTVAFGNDTPVNETNDNRSAVDLASGIGGKMTKPADDKAVQNAVISLDRARAQRRAQAAKVEVEHLKEIQKKITEELQKTGLSDNVRFTIDQRGLIVTIITSAVVFAGDRADLLPDGQRILDGIGPAIAVLPNNIEVDGHTNQLPVQTINYPSGWELSTARASTVVRYLNTRAGIPRERMFAAGFADTRPLYPPADPRAPALNRRVEIVVLSTLPADERALLPSANGTGDDTATGNTATGNTATGNTATGNTATGNTATGSGTGGPK